MPPWAANPYCLPPFPPPCPPRVPWGARARKVTFVDDSITTAFNDGASQYATAGAPFLPAATSLVLDRLNLAPGGRLVDLACGPGTIALPAAQRVGRGGAVIGLDLAERHLALARQSAPAGPSIRFQRQDACAPSLADDSADAIACGLGLPYFHEPVRAMRESVRVARDRAPLVWSTWGAPFLGRPGERFLNTLGRNDIPLPLPTLLHTTESLAQIAFRSGVRDVVIEEHDIDYHYPDFNAWWTMLEVFALRVTVTAHAAAPPPPPILRLESTPEPLPPIDEQLRTDPAIVNADGSVAGRMRLLILRGSA